MFAALNGIVRLVILYKCSRSGQKGEKKNDEETNYLLWGFKYMGL